MIGLFITIINMSIAASIVAIAVILARFPLKRTPKIFSHALWAVVFLRLICPFSIESSTSLMPVNAEPIPTTILSAPSPRIDSGITAVDGTVNRIMENALSLDKPAEIANPLQTLFSISAYVWLGGVFVFVLYTLITYGFMKRMVFDATLRDGNIYETDKISTGFILGLFRPKIYVPTSVVGSEQLDYILKHEQIHIRRRDYLIKPLAFLVLAVHWFNPIVWISYYLMTKDMEMSCDEAVLRKYNEDVRQAYSLTLVNLYTQKTSLLSPLAFGEGNFRNMKERLKNVLKYKKTPRSVIAFCSILLVLFLAAFTTNPPRNISVDNLFNEPSTSDKASDSLLDKQAAASESMYPLPEASVYESWKAMRPSDYIDTEEWTNYYQNLRGYRPVNYVPAYSPAILKNWLSPVDGATATLQTIQPDSGSHILGYRASFEVQDRQAVRAISDGVVVEIIDTYFDNAEDPYHLAMMGLDQHIVVQYDEHIKVRYLHLAPESYAVQLGDEVSAGDILGQTYGTYLYTGPDDKNAGEYGPYRCDIEILVDGVLVNPADYFDDNVHMQFYFRF